MKNSYHIFVYIGLLLLIFGSGFQVVDHELVKTPISENIQMSIPKAFQAMTEDLLNQRYLTARKPIAAYTNDQQMIDLTVNTSNTRWQASDLPILKDFYKASLLELYDEIDFTQEEIEEINGKNFVVFAFTSIVRPEANALNPQQPVRKYTRIQYTVQGGKTLVFNFSCPQALQRQWEETSQEIMKSIQIK